jgi:putative membrane protein
VAGFVAGSVLASYWAPLRRLFVSSREMQEEVARAASHVFALGRLAATRERTGLLIYVSLFERQVVILADTRAAEALGEDGLGVLRDIAAGRLREGKTIETFLETLQVAAERLAAALPPGAENPEEISGQVLLFHPRP